MGKKMTIEDFVDHFGIDDILAEIGSEEVQEWLEDTAEKLVFDRADDAASYLDDKGYYIFKFEDDIKDEYHQEWLDDLDDDDMIRKLEEQGYEVRHTFSSIASAGLDIHSILHEYYNSREMQIGSQNAIREILTDMLHLPYMTDEESLISLISDKLKTKQLKLAQ